MVIHVQFHLIFKLLKRYLLGISFITTKYCAHHCRWHPKYSLTSVNPGCTLYYDEANNFRFLYK